jgi:hypothetical protein
MKMKKYVQFVRTDLVENLNWGEWDAYALLDFITDASINIGIKDHHTTQIRTMGWNVWPATALQRGFIGFDVNIREEKTLIVYVCVHVCVCDCWWRPLMDANEVH